MPKVKPIRSSATLISSVLRPGWSIRYGTLVAGGADPRTAFTFGNTLPPVPLVARSGGGLRARASDQGFLPIDTQKYVMLLGSPGDA
jgi:hypothetical protein